MSVVQISQTPAHRALAATGLPAINSAYFLPSNFRSVSGLLNNVAYSWSGNARNPHTDPGSAAELVAIIIFNKLGRRRVRLLRRKHIISLK